MDKDYWNNLSLPDLFAGLVDVPWLATLITQAKLEDIEEAGDITSRSLVPESLTATAQMRTRAAGRLAGLPLLDRIAEVYDSDLDVELMADDGDPVNIGDVVAQITGPLRGILTAERVMLNFVTHLSGIATLTEQFVQQTVDTPAKIYDTRKTIPGWRHLAKYAVRCGGGYCHRIGLFDAVLAKDNHVAHLATADLGDALVDAIARAKTLTPAPAFIEVEVDTLAQLEQVLGCGVDMVLLDNMDVPTLTEAVAMRDVQAWTVELEASGGVNLQTVRRIAQAGVDRIAIGALTHSAPVLDLGLDIQRS